MKLEMAGWLRKRLQKTRRVSSPPVAMALFTFAATQREMTWWVTVPKGRQLQDGVSQSEA